MVTGSWEARYATFGEAKDNLDFNARPSGGGSSLLGRKLGQLWNYRDVRSHSAHGYGNPPDGEGPCIKSPPPAGADREFARRAADWAVNMAAGGLRRAEQEGLDALGAWMRQERQARGFSLDDVAAKLQMAPHILCSMESGFGATSEFANLVDSWSEVLGICRDDIPAFAAQARLDSKQDETGGTDE